MKSFFHQNGFVGYPPGVGDGSTRYAKRSTDKGASWSALREVSAAGAGTWGSPTAVYDRDRGRVWLFMSWNDQYKTQISDFTQNPLNFTSSTLGGSSTEPSNLNLPNLNLPNLNLLR